MQKHPRLAKKLSLLYSSCVKPSIKSNADLAKALGISRQAISKWIHGSETQVGDCIPSTQVQIVSALFDIQPHWFTLSIDEFELKLHHKLEFNTNGHHTGPDQLSVSLLPITNVQIFGRDHELNLLDHAWMESTNNVVEVIAFGGVGKSTLINSWLSRLDKYNYLGAKRVYAWSFYWQGSGVEIKSSGDYFIEHALEWFGDEDPVQGTPWAKATRLANLIRKSRTLLILDGLEPIQYPPGEYQGRIENPAVALLVRELASDNNGLCVITSRISVTDLIAFQDGRVESIDLNHLNTAAGIEVLKNLGVKGEDSEFSCAVEEYAGHPLCLSLLAGYLNVVHGGDIAKYRELDSLVESQDFGAQAKKLVRVYLKWFQNSHEIALLYMLGLFDRAVTLEDIKILSSKEPIAKLTQELSHLTVAQWGYAVKKLQDANLISVNRRDDGVLIDCHPLIRDFLADYLKREEPKVWIQGNSLIFRHLQSIAVENPANMAEFEPLFRAVIHGARAKLYEESFQLYFERIKNRYCMLTGGSHHTDQICIKAFFNRLWADPVDDLSEEAKFHLLSSAATNLMSLGKIDEAIDPSEKSINWFVKQEKWLEATMTAGPFVSMLIAAGSLKRAIALLSELEECVSNTNNMAIQAMSFNFQAYAYYLNGENDKARALFEQAEAILTLSDPGAPVIFPTVSSYYCKFLLETGEVEKALLRLLKTFAWRESKSWQVAVDTTSLYASDVLVLGLTFLELGDLKNAEKQLNKQVELFRSADEWLYLPTGLNARAKFFIETCKYQEANQDLEEAMMISQRTDARFSQWETCIYFAALNLKQKNYGLAESYLVTADGIPDMNSYRFRNSEIAQLKSRLALALNH
ncbi:MAG: hypothetical protein COA96_03865 [SAR86 cluster bacterium]|uniref:HTH cro/C1-type domain-containing protein n=1 Tax=SAR86 cluster bacterium TaxID=2030880 RepID=A0A2A5B6T0_9GAMM|nr:MAG: hypothetical protein COA96_03865 [SAR86 cluster bacterium]